MLTRQFARLILKTYRRTRPRSWQRTADEFNKKYGADKSKGWYLKIATQGYDPASQEDRHTFGLGPRPCPTCHRRITVPCTEHVNRTRISDMTTKALLHALNNREEIVAEYNPRVMRAFINACKSGGVIRREIEATS